MLKAAKLWQMRNTHTPIHLHSTLFCLFISTLSPSLSIDKRKEINIYKGPNQQPDQAYPAYKNKWRLGKPQNGLSLGPLTLARIHNLFLHINWSRVISQPARQVRAIALVSRRLRREITSMHTGDCKEIQNEAFKDWKT